MSRSTHTARAVALLATVAASALALSACTGSGGGGPMLRRRRRVAPVVGLDSDQAPNGYDPLLYSAGQRFFFEGMYDSLFRLDETGAVVPDLVTAFEYNEDQTELTLDLDTSATFDDGSTLSAELVAQNLDSRDNPNSPHTRPSRPGAERDHRRQRRRRRHRHTGFAGAKPGFEANLVVPVRRHRRTRSGSRSVCARHRAGWLRTPHGRHGCHRQGQLLRAGEEGRPPGRRRATPSTRTSSVPSSTRRRA